MLYRWFKCKLKPPKNEVTNRQAKTNTNQRREERKQNAFPTATSIIVLRIQIAFTQATTYLINRQVG